MGESERKGKEAGELKASRQKEILLMPKKVFVTVLVWGFYSQTPFTKYQKNQNQKLLQETKREDNQKVTKKKSKRSKAQER